MTSPTPVISIVMPVRNAASTLPACLRSIRRQTLVDFEAVAIDDGSTDASAAILEQEARADRRLRVMESGGRGLVAALQAGVAASRAPLIARMDADDLMHPRRLALQAAALAADRDLALVAARAVAWPRAEVRDGMRAYLAWQNSVLTPAQVHDEIYVEAPFVHPTVMVRRAALDAVGGYRDGPFPEDYDLWLRLHDAGHPMAKLPRVLLAWRERPGRASRRDPRYARERFDALRAEHLSRDPRLSGRPIAFWGAGRRTRSRARRLIERGFPPVAWIDIDPAKIGRTLDGAPVRPPAWLAGRARPFVLVYVTNHGARPLIQAALEGLGYEVGRDTLFVG